MPADLTPLGIEWGEPTPHPDDILAAPDRDTAVRMGHQMATVYRAGMLAATEGWHQERIKNTRLERRLSQVIANNSLGSEADRG